MLTMFAASTTSTALIVMAVSLTQLASTSLMADDSWNNDVNKKINDALWDNER